MRWLFLDNCLMDISRKNVEPSDTHELLLLLQFGG